MSSTGDHRRSFINAVIDSCLIPHNNLWLCRREGHVEEVRNWFSPKQENLDGLCLFIFAHINTVEKINITAVKRREG